jgi:hypothetical protein
MTSFNEAEHPRAAAGKFAEKPQSPAEAQLVADETADRLSAEAIATSVINRWKTEVATGWATGHYTPNEDQIAEMIAEAVLVSLKR